MLKKPLWPAALAAVLPIARAAEAHALSRPKAVNPSSTLVRNWARDHFVFTESDLTYPQNVAAEISLRARERACRWGRR